MRFQEKDNMIDQVSISKITFQAYGHHMDMDQQDNGLQPTQQEIDRCLDQIQIKLSPGHVQNIIEALYIRYNHRNELSEREHSIAQTHLQPPSVLQDQRPQQSLQVDHNKPQFQVRELVGKVKQKRQKTQDRDWLKDKPQEDKDKIISGQIWDRYKYRQDRMDRMSTISKGNRVQAQENLIKALSWDYSEDTNKEHRLYANKVAPRFNSKDQEHKFYEKRLAAKTFIDKNYEKMKLQVEENGSKISVYGIKNGLGRTQNDRYDLQGGNKPRYSTYAKNVRSNYSYSDKRRYKTVSIAFVSEAFRRFQLFVMQHIDKKIRQLIGPQIKELYSILLNAEHYFPEQQFDTFRRFVKISFDLGSVSVYDLQSKRLYRCIQEHLNYKMNQNKEDNGSVMDDLEIPWINQEDFRKMYPEMESDIGSEQSQDRQSKVKENRHVKESY